MKDLSMHDAVEGWGEALSALIDGEGLAHELDALLRAQLSQRHEQDRAWSAYLVVGAALREQPGRHLLPSSTDFAAAVSARLAAGLPEGLDLMAARPHLG